MIFTIGLGFLISVFLCPVIIQLCKKYDLYDEVDPRKIHTGKIPRLGGVAIFSAFLISFLVYEFFISHDKMTEYLPLFAGGIIILATGICDDFLNLRARLKFLLQIAAALCVSLSSFYYKEAFGLVFPVWLGKAGTFFWILLIVNAYNLIDGLDALCGGLSFLTMLTFGVIGFVNGWAMQVPAFLICACLLGFLVWNKPNAKIFMGDGGSLTIGYMISIMPLFVTPSEITGNFENNRVLISLLITSIPNVDVLAAVIRRKREKRSFFSPDRSHLHHKLLNIGFTKISVLVILLALQVLISAVVILSGYGKNVYGTILLSSAYAFVLLFFSVLHYVNRAVNRKMKGHLEDHPQEEH